MREYTLAEITQSVIAFTVVAGGGVLMLIEPSLREALVGLEGLVIGFYFNRAMNGGGQTPNPLLPGRDSDR